MYIYRNSFFPLFEAWLGFTGSIPDAYWNVWSEEQRYKWLCIQICKLVEYSNEQTKWLEALNKAINDIEEQQPDLIDEAVKAEIERLVNSGEFYEMVREALYALQPEKAVQTIEYAECIYRKLDFDINETLGGGSSLQGGTVFTNAQKLYYAYVGGINDDNRLLKVVDIETQTEIASVAIPSGHYGTISIDENTLIIGNYTTGYDTYGSIFYYDVLNPNEPTLVNTITLTAEQLDALKPVGFSAYKDNKLLIEGQAINHESAYYSGIYEFNPNTSEYTHLFDFSRIRNGFRPQPFTYDKELDQVVSHTTKLAGLTYYNMDGTIANAIGIKNEYQFISIGELENLTCIGSDIYFAGLHVGFGGKCSSIHLFHYNAFTKPGKFNAMYQGGEYVQQVSIDSDLGHVIPQFDNKFVSNNDRVKYPNDAINYIRYLNKNGFYAPILRAFGTHDCALYIECVNCRVNLLNSYFNNGVIISDSNISFNDFRNYIANRVESDYSMLLPFTQNAIEQAAALDKPAYLTCINSNIKFALIAPWGTPINNAYIMRFVNCSVFAAPLTNYINIAVQHSELTFPLCRIQNLTIESGKVTCALIDYATAQIKESVSVNAMIDGLFEPATRIPIRLPNNNIEVLTIIKNGVRLGTFEKTVAGDFAINCDGQEFKITRTTDGVTLPTNTGYQYQLGYR